MKNGRIGAYTSISLDLENCGGPLRDVDEADRLFTKLIKKSGMTKRKTLKDTFESAEGNSYMLIYTLGESLLFIQSFMIETWPEVRGVKIVIDLCHFKRNNHPRAKLLARGCKEIFKPGKGRLIVKRETVEDMEGW